MARQDVIDSDSGSAYGKIKNVRGRLGLTVAVASLTALVLACNSGGTSGSAPQELAAASAPSPEEVLTEGIGVPFEECGSNPDWEQPSREEMTLLVQADPRWRGLLDDDPDKIWAVYEQHFYSVGPGESVNKGWVILSGLGTAQDVPWGPDQGCASAATLTPQRVMRLYLIGHHVKDVLQLDNGFAVRVQPVGRGYSAVNVHPESHDGASCIYFVGPNDQLLFTLGNPNQCPT